MKPLGESLKKYSKKVRGMFGTYTQKLYLCIRFR